MTDELTKTFFDAFGIKQKTNQIYGIQLDYHIEDYPQITDHILLELICIHNQYSHPFSIYGEKKEFLKNDILECMINMLNYFYEHEMGEYSQLKHQVQALFLERSVE